MDRIEPIGPRPPQWQPVELDPDREDLAERRRRREEQQRGRRGRGETIPPPAPNTDEDPPHRIDVRV